MEPPSEAKIKEMKARGFDRTVILAEMERLEQWRQAPGVIEQIEVAFAGVTLGGGVGLNQAVGLDNYLSDPELDALRATDIKDDWHDLQICPSSSLLTYFDAEGLRFHLPAYLLAWFHGNDSADLIPALTNLSETNLRKFSLLSPSQRTAVRAFLLFIQKTNKEYSHRKKITVALQSYWKR